MKIISLGKLATLLLLGLLLILGTATVSFAWGGSVYVYYGTNATAGENDAFGSTWLNPSGNGTGGSIKVNGDIVNNGDHKDFSSNNIYPVVITPSSTYKISSAVLFKFRFSFGYWQEISARTISIDLPASGSTTDSVTLDANGNSGKDYYLLVVKFTDTVNQVSYSIDADVAATPATNCKGTASISPVSPVNVADGATQSFTISNTDAACSVYSIDYDNSGALPVGSLSGWNSGTGTFTTPAISKDTSFIVKYKKNTYQVTTQVDAAGAACGTISPGTASYGTGSNQAFTLTTPSGCGIEAFTDNGTDAKSLIVPMGTTNTYTLSNITANHTLIVKFVTVSTSSGAAYCQVPPFMDGQNVLKPNVLLIFDTSGSMACGAYYKNYNQSYCPSSKTYDCTDSSALSNCTNFYGYFDNAKMYKLSGSTYTIDATATASGLKLGPNSGNGLSGNYLNYKEMRRVDVIRKILVGGKVSSTIGAARTAATGGTNVRYLQTHNGKFVEYGTTNPTGLIDQVAGNVRLGLMVFNPNDDEISTSLDSDGARLSVEIGSSATDLIDKIENETQPNGSTPLAESVYEGLRYFQGGESAYNSYNGSTKILYNGTITDSNDPHRVYAKPVQGSCQNNYMILLTDGEPTNDKNIPGESASSGWWHPVTINSTVSDSSYTTWQTAHKSSTPFPDKLLGQVAYYLHSYDLAAGAPTWDKAADQSKLQAVRLFTVFSFGDTTGAAYLQQAAKFGSFLEDATITGTNKDGKPNVNAEFISDATDPTTTKGYFEADDGAVLQAQLVSIFESIATSTASGTAAAVANNKSGQRGANMIQALFYPQFPTDNTKKWMGEVQGLWYYLDPLVNYSSIMQDSTTDQELNLLTDNLLPDDPFETKALWKAGAKLQSTSPTARKLYVLLDSTKELTDVDKKNEFIEDNKATLKTASMMNIASLANPEDMINYIRGVSKSFYRNRTVSFTDPITSTTVTDVWKLGDIVNSTPVVQSGVQLNSYDLAYSDSTYKKFISTTDYKARNVVYTGSNDGMFHSFRLGVTRTISDPSNPYRVAALTGTDLGKEEWAFIPKNALPYMQYQCGSDYCHQYTVDGAPVVIDASILKYATCSETNYWDCERGEKATTSTTIPNSWQTVVVSSMGLGGASRDASLQCNETYSSSSKIDCVKTPVAGIGMSSYFALNVTDPLVPKYMWEFSDYSMADTSDKGLGFTTPGSLIVRINTDTTTEGKKKNGRWFSVMASGPTGAIDSTNRYFSGHSDQNLKIYVVDLNAREPFVKCTGPYSASSNCNYWVIGNRPAEGGRAADVQIPFAFANSINGASIDLDRSSSLKPGYYSDDVIYVTYTKASLTAGKPTNSTAWNKGGVLRLVTNNNSDPYYWFTSKLIDDVGPITTSVARIQDKEKKKLWIFFGEGRYFFPGDERTGTVRKFYGLQDPCYTQYQEYTGSSAGFENYAMKTTQATCTGFDSATQYIYDQTGDTPAASLPATVMVGVTSKDVIGWSVNMATATGTSGDERVISDVSATYNGLVFYTTYTPNTDVCTPGGVTSLWAVQYNSGGTPAASALQGKAPIQTSSGGIKLISLANSFTQKGGRKLDAALSPSGMAPRGKFPPLLKPKPSKQILQVREN